ncbi:hypothetical protein AGLY_005336 [Aphis glycines]|uniref:Uncharacterized protein n=1 Tax=Aphis glycines TaxID=307491 RepID=A0A6G0TWU3_APHGL|nr:hypothetical protein AGLY_005336 [Aphis glycines]
MRLQLANIDNSFKRTSYPLTHLTPVHFHSPVSKVFQKGHNITFFCSSTVISQCLLFKHASIRNLIVKLFELKRKKCLNNIRNFILTNMQILNKICNSMCLNFVLLLSDSERSDECIDFTMIITSRNNASISNFGGGFRWKSEYPWCIIEFSKKSRKKNDGKTGIFTQNQFLTESIF